MVGYLRIITNFKRENAQGFTEDEIQRLLKYYPGINMKAFQEALFGDTCMVVKGKTIRYTEDIVSAIWAGLPKNIKELRRAW
jgi:hypothetical protein